MCILLAAVYNIMHESGKASLSYQCPLFVAGITVGILSFNGIVNEAVIADLLESNPNILNLIFLGTVFFRKFLFLDGYLLVPCLMQALLFIVVSIMVDMLCLWSLFVTYYGLSQMVSLDNEMVFLCCLYPITSVRTPECIIKPIKNISGRKRAVMTFLEVENIMHISKAVILIWCLKNFLTTNYAWAYLIEYVCLGIIVGYIAGLIFCLSMSIILKDKMAAVLWTIAFPMSIVYADSFFGSSVMVVCILGVCGILFNFHKRSFSPEYMEIVDFFWSVIDLTVCAVLAFIVGAAVSNFYKVSNFNDEEHRLYYPEIILYACAYVVLSLSRYLSLLITWPFLRMFSSGFNWKDFLLAGWCNITSVYQLLVALQIFCISNIVCANLLIMSSVIFILSHIINAPVAPLFARVIQESEISVFNTINLDNCMRHLIEVSKAKMEAIKRDQNPGPLNWPHIRTVILTENQYKFSQFSPGLMDYNATRAYSLMRVLKTVRITYIKMYETGIVQQKVLNILLDSVDDALYAADKMWKFEYITHCFEKRRILKRIWLYLIEMQKREARLRKPKVFWCAVFFALRTNYVYVCTLEFTVLAEIICVIFHLHTKLDLRPFYIYITVLQIFEICVNIIAASRHGWIRSVKFCFSGITAFLFVTMLIQWSIWILYDTGGAVKAYRLSILYVVLRFIRTVYFITSHIYARVPDLREYVEYKVNEDLIFLYSLGKAYINGHDEILDNLDNLVTDKAISKHLELKLVREKQEILRRLGQLSQSHPWVVITVKTKDVTRIVLNETKKEMDDMKTLGKIDEVEYERLYRSYERQIKAIASYQKPIRPASVEVLFNTVKWLRYIDPDDKSYLLKSTTLQMFETDEYVYEPGERSVGVFIVCSGVIKIKYQPSSDVLTDLARYGALPTVEGFNSLNFDSPSEQFVINGESFGEMGVLTKRRYNCSIQAETHCNCYVISKEAIHNIFETKRSPRRNLEAIMWKHVTMPLAIQVLMQSRDYNCTREDAYKTLERSFIPNLKDYKIFAVDVAIVEVILIQGIAMDVNNNHIYYAPAYIPRNVEKLAMPKSELLPIKSRISTKLMIVPARDTDEVTLMKNVEAVSEIWSRSSGRCLYYSLDHDPNDFHKLPQKRVATDESESLAEEHPQEREPLKFTDEGLTPVGVRNKKICYRDMRLPVKRDPFKVRDDNKVPDEWLELQDDRQVKFHPGTADD
ncbi:uncharacterized protein LOC109604671 isoform X2 [Aethina tumida]|uniref:uncharacterized protein LOC109604671 isoform X2 n=1 Tax=Aethina tumida TaxID=116153 RepID=UPI0021483063|nr:uncharacterized protein LOC109604671 isoform X2 [Aethina tumida]